jgi:hypothetical protein
MKTLIAKRDLFYANRTYVKGQEFRAANQHASTLIACGMADEAPAQETRSSTPPPEPEPPAAPEPAARRQYRRRDMRAEE